jgi:hypothetical protein
MKKGKSLLSNDFGDRASRRERNQVAAGYVGEHFLPACCPLKLFPIRGISDTGQSITSSCRCRSSRESRSEERSSTFSIFRAREIDFASGRLIVAAFTELLLRRGFRMICIQFWVDSHGFKSIFGLTITSRDSTVCYCSLRMPKFSSVAWEFVGTSCGEATFENPAGIQTVASWNGEIKSCDGSNVNVITII